MNQVASSFVFTVRQTILIVLAALAYFGVRGLTEGDPVTAHDNAARLLEVEEALGLAFELQVQQTLGGSEMAITLANWIYIWGHWPLIAATLFGLATVRRPQFYQLRNAMFISGGIGLAIFATWAVAPPRLYGAEYLDTVTIRSTSYRLLQPPSLVNKYAAVPSLHFGWNLLVGMAWARASNNRWVTVAAVVMPIAMAYAVVVTANHWILDVAVGGIVALTGYALERITRQPLARFGRSIRNRIEGGVIQQPESRDSEVPARAGR